LTRIPDDRFEPIRFLVARKFPHYRDTYSFRAKFLPRPIMDDETARLQIEQYEKELAGKTPEEISKLVEDQREIERRELIEFEANQWFNKPSSQARFDFWCKAEYWTLEEATILSLGKEPNKVRWEDFRPEHFTFRFSREFRDRRELTKRADTMGNLSDPIRPKKFLEWAKRKELSYAPELEIIITRENGVDTSWKVKYDQEATAHSQVNDELEAARTKIRELMEKPGWLRERDSLLKLVIGMAVKGYAYVPAAQKNSAVQDIANDLRLLGIPLDEDTVRKYLNEAKPLIPES